MALAGTEEKKKGKKKKGKIALTGATYTWRDEGTRVSYRRLWALKSGLRNHVDGMHAAHIACSLDVNCSCYYHTCRL